MDNHRRNNMKTAMEANGKLQGRPLECSKGDRGKTAKGTNGKPQRDKWKTAKETNGNSQSDQRETATGTNGKP